MITINGYEYTIQDPDDAALSCLNYLNTYFSDNNVKDSDGNTLYIEPNISNPLFMLIMGVGYLTGTLQKMIYSAASGISISESADRQLLNLARIARLRRRAATKTTVMLTMQAEGSTEVRITKDSVVTQNIGQDTVIFAPTQDMVIPAGGSINIVYVANIYGSFSIPAGQINKLDTPIPGLYSVTNAASVPGQAQETIPELRARMNALSNARTQIDNAADAITQLDGVTMCNVYFNYSTVDGIMISGITVPPRMALVIVQGYSDHIAEAFYSNMMCLTAGQGDSRAVVQNYTTNAQQVIPMYFIPPRNKAIDIRIYVSGTLSTAQQDLLKDAVMALAANMRIAAPITAGQVIRVCAERAQGVAVNDVEISVSGDDSWSYMITPQPDEIISLNRNNVVFV